MTTVGLEEQESHCNRILQEIFFWVEVRGGRDSYALGKRVQTRTDLQAADVVQAVSPHVQRE